MQLSEIFYCKFYGIKMSIEENIIEYPLCLYFLPDVLKLTPTWSQAMECDFEISNQQIFLKELHAVFFVRNTVKKELVLFLIFSQIYYGFVS